MRHEVFFNVVADYNWNIKHIPYQKRPKTLPEILSKQEIQSLLSVITDPKHLAIVSILYGCGLRVSECLNLKLEDIDSANMVLIVRNGKGNKDRVTILSPKLLGILRSYYRSCKVKPVGYLFPMRYDPHKTFSKRQVELFVSEAGKKAGIVKRVYPHILRHSFATHLLDSGVPLHKVQRILGHGSLRSTSIYIHLAKDFLKEVTSPLDNMEA